MFSKKRPEAVPTQHKAKDRNVGFWSAVPSDWIVERFQWIYLFLLQLPKGPFRTKNVTTIVKLVNYYAVVFLLRPPYLLRRGPFFERKKVFNSQENGVRTRCAAIVDHSAIVKIHYA